MSMQIHKSVNETQAEFVARAFRWNRLMGEALAARKARHALCNCNQGRLSCVCKGHAECSDCTPQPARPFVQATPMARDELRKLGMLPTAPRPLLGVSRVRACWYGAGLVFGVACIAMAVFGMGQ
jgi:hypothetical protein